MTTKENIGGICIMIGLTWIHPGLALIVLGAGLIYREDKETKL